MNLVFDILFPKKCLGCQKIGAYFCPNCIPQILQSELICPFCARPAIGGAVHPVCRRPYGLDGLWSLGAYKPPLLQAILKLKYRLVSTLTQSLIDLMVEYWALHQPFLLEKIKKDHGRNWLIVPVPLHKSRQNWRGFNQSALLGQILAATIGLPFAQPLIRIKNTTPQVKLEAHKRKQNIKNAFALALPLPAAAKIILIDDVWTTGSTIKECCLVLKKGGAKQVWALTLAR